jgi:4-amino-4-deoxy-L-arabinose transferase-like glycosyltransferase
MTDETLAQIPAKTGLSAPMSIGTQAGMNLPKHFWLYALLIFLLIISLWGIFDRDFINYTELRESGPGREFLMPHHNWAIPTLNNYPYIEKPPLVYWTVALSLQIFGINDWAARVPCVLFGWGILFFTYLLAKRLYNKKIGFAALLVLATTAGFLARTHEMESDIGLFFFITGGAYFLYRAFTGSAWWYWLFYLFALGAFFSKGLIGFIFLGLIFLAWAIWNRVPKEILRARPWIGIAIISIPIILWLIKLANSSYGNLLHFYLIENQLERFFPTKTYSLGNVNPFYYYFTTLPVQFAPWIIILIVAIPWLWSQRREPSLKFLLCWFLPGFLFLTLSGTKRALYLAPLLPPIAIMVAVWFTAKAKERWLTISAVIVGIGVIIFYSLNISQVSTKESWRPLYKKLASMVGTETKLYGYEPTEATSAAIPFYVGRYFTVIWGESNLEAVSRQANAEIVVVTFGNRHNTPYFQKISKYFPYLWLEKNDVMDAKMIRVYSNIPPKNQ